MSDDGTMTTQADKGRRFAELHERDGIFVMPNAWDAGSAKMLAHAGFEALGTTSAGTAFSLGIPDAEGVLTLEQAVENTRDIAMAVELPVSVDSESCYADDAAGLAETVRQLAAAGAVAASIEDLAGPRDIGLYSREEATARVRAVCDAAKALDFPFTVTARSEAFLVRHEHPLDEAIERLNLFREAGADCLYAPGIRSADDIGRLVREVDGPINMLMGLPGIELDVRTLEDLGVRRISIGGVLARIAFASVQQAADEIRESGTFGFCDQHMPGGALNEIFRER